MWLKLFIVVAATAQQVNIAKAACIIDLKEMPVRSPVLLHPETFHIFHANNKSTVVLECEKTIVAACPGGVIDYNDRNLMFITCNKENDLIFEGKKFRFMDRMECLIENFPKPVKTNKRCGSKGAEIVIGSYIEPQVYFLPMLTVCYDFHLEMIEYTKHTTGYYVVDPHKIEEGQQMRSTEFYGAEIVDSKTELRKRVNHMVGLPDDSLDIYGRTYYFNRSLLTTTASHEYYFLANASYTTLNAFYDLYFTDCINLNWHTIDLDIVRLPERINTPVEIYTGLGRFDSVRHPETKEEVNITISDEHPVPMRALRWRVIYEPKSKRAVVLFLFNAIEATVMPCQSMTIHLNWSDYIKCPFPTYHFHTICEYHEAIKIAPELPNLPVVGILNP